MKGVLVEVIGLLLLPSLLYHQVTQVFGMWAVVDITTSIPLDCVRPGLMIGLGYYYEWMCIVLPCVVHQQLLQYVALYSRWSRNDYMLR